MMKIEKENAVRLQKQKKVFDRKLKAARLNDATPPVAVGNIPGMFGPCSWQTCLTFFMLQPLAKIHT